ncbi:MULTISPECIES: lipopolysaccharide biosynthesis protein [Gordonia]|uniref:lipopolysaccharide biosynthesis protein n=1 Tax=Gordonia TaxID=2053 RepID=UPI000BB7962C|nr:lipopolysaccharide biosynthesis protein [Gordonia sp. 1D]ATD69830.1 hypothetical protein CNO18_05620 [Gordonia sp. 1D]UOG21059.1 lipopolysaccharide biosynthesis protein [Gordonia amicalis]
MTAQLKASPVPKGVSGQAALLAVGRLGAAGIQAVCFGLLARDLGPSGFGIFAAAYGGAVVVQAVATLGLGQYIVSRRALGDVCRDRVIGALRMSLSSTLVLLLGVCCVGVYSAAESRHVGLLVTILSAWALVDNYAESWLAVSLADGRAIENSLLTIMRRVVAFAVLLVGMLTSIRLDLCFSAGLLLGSVFAVVVARSRVGRDLEAGYKPGWSFAILREACGYWANSVLTQIRNMDSAVLGMFGASSSAVGLYSAASRLTNPLRIIPTSFAVALLPHAARTGIRGYRSLIKPILYVSVLGAVVFGCVAAVAPLVTAPLLGEEYSGAVVPIQIVCVGLVFAGVASQLNSVLLAWQRSGLAAGCSLIAALACFGGLVYVAQSHRGASAAAFSLSLSFVVQLGLLLCCISFVLRAERR